MISVIVYGRNDAHGYNLHRRAALSLNCIAELLSDSDDEILFVDYNTPDELPTFVEALADTLTERCLDLLRVIRIPAAIHVQRFAARTHLPALEPIARNAAARRANPANRWLLSTNTDMVFLPRDDRSLSEILRELPDGFYGLPRYELPEWLWERLPRTDPGRAMSEIGRLGPALRLDEATLSTEWIRFDAPGDFQLVLRDDFLAIDGLDEEMILGYHVDSNFSKRMLLHRGSIESLEDQLAGYHCNHNRTPTVYHGATTVTNDLERFFLDVDRPELPAQRRSWGLADDELEEISVRDRSWDRFADAVVAAAPDSAAPRSSSDAARIPFELTYDTGHVLPFVADSLAVSPQAATIGYVGANAVLQESLASVIAKLDGGRSLAVADLNDPISVDALGRSADLFIIDLGIDAALVDASTSTAGDHQPAELPAALARAFVGLERLIERERERLGCGEHPRRFVLVHSWTVFWDAYVLANMDCSHSTAHSRVRRATVRPVPIDDELTRELVAQERRLIRWAARGELGRRRFHLHAREAVSLGDVADYGGFGDGWAFPEEKGLWTQGTRSEIALALDGIEETDHVLALILDSICVAPEATLKVEAFANGERLVSRAFQYGDPDWNIALPATTVAGGALDLAFEIEEPRSLRQLGLARDDDRPLGILLQTMTVLPAADDAAQAGLARERRLAGWAARAHGGDRRLHVPLGGAVDLTTLSDYGGFGGGWAYQDEAGIWTEGPESELALALDGMGDGYYGLGLSLGTIATEPGSALEVKAFANGERVASRELNFGDPEWRFELPPSVSADGNVELRFELDRLRSPLELGWSDDDRPLGLLLRSLRLEEVDRTVPLDERIVFDETSGAERFLGEGWSIPEREGVWTEGDRANLVLMLADDIPDDAELVLNAAPFVAPDHPVIEVQASARGEQLARRVFRHGEAPRVLRVPLPPARGRTVVELTLHDPARPADLGLGDDQRRLGIQLRWLMARRSTRRATLLDAARAASGKVLSRLS